MRKTQQRYNHKVFLIYMMEDEKLTAASISFCFIYMYIYVFCRHTEKFCFVWKTANI